MENLAILAQNPNEQKFTSKYLVEQINIFRKEEGNDIELLHKSLITKLEKEFEDEIEQQNILPSSYLAGNGKQEKCYELNFEYSLQLLMSESKTVRKRCVEVMKANTKPMTLLEAAEALVASLKLIEKQAVAIDNMSVAFNHESQWLSILKVAMHNKVNESEFNWRLLKKNSDEMGYEVKRMASRRFRYQNIYHVNVWRKSYPFMKYDFEEIKC